MKRIIKVVAILLLLALFLSACGIVELEVSLSGNPASAIVTEQADSAGGVQSDDGASMLTVYFLDVGQGDAALLLCDGKAMLIDGGDASSSRLIHSVLHSYGITHIDYLIATHGHEDHIGGLAAALNYATVGTAFSPVIEYESRAFGNFVRYLDVRGASITVPNHGDNFMFGSAEVTVVGPINPSDNPNNTSIVLKVTHGDISFLFSGDAERQLEEDIVEAGHDISATVLKVGHHGSDTSTTYPFLREVMPSYAVISCASGNIYGHPEEDLLSRLRDADVTLYRTDMQGTIAFVSDRSSVSITTGRNFDIQTNPTQSIIAEDYYIGNINSKRLHRPSCSGLPQEQNRILFDTWDEAANDGYLPCGTCNP